MSEEGLKCPPECVYSMLIYGASGEKAQRHCGYILITGHMRGCDPGMNCTRYLRGKRLPQSSLKGIKRKGRSFGWDEPGGKELWKQGKSDREIARELGVSWKLVNSTKNRKWRKGK